MDKEEIYHGHPFKDKHSKKISDLLTSQLGSIIKIKGTIKKGGSHHMEIGIGEYVMVCKSDLNISAYEPDDEVCLIVRTELSTDIWGVIGHILLICTKESWKQMYPLYKLIKKQTDQIKKIPMAHKIAQIKRPFPLVVYNIGLIQLGLDNKTADLAKLLFETKCVGELFVFTIEELALDNKIDLTNALNFFSSYYQIDLIIMVTGDLTTEQYYCMCDNDLINDYYSLIESRPPLCVLSDLSQQDIPTLLQSFADYSYVCVSQLIDDICQSQSKHIASIKSLSGLYSSCLRQSYLQLKMNHLDKIIL